MSAVFSMMIYETMTTKVVNLIDIYVYIKVKYVCK